MRNTIKTILGLGLVLALFTGCNERIPAGYKGKVMTKDGWATEVYPPGTVWLNEFFTTVSDKLFLIQTTTKKYNQPIKILLKDKLTLKADIIFRGRITDNKKVVNHIFNDLTMNDSVVTIDEVYNTYGKMIVLNTARDVISKYTVDEVNKNYGRITVELYNAIKPKLKGLPIQISDVTVGNIEYPAIVTKAVENAKARRMKIEQEKAQVQIELEKAKGREAVAKAEYRIKMLEAKRIRDYNKMIQEGVSDKLLKLRKLEIQEKMVEAIKNNKNVIYMPMEMMKSSNNIRVIK